MTNNTITVMKKELARFFGDRRLVITTLLLPGIMIYVVYSFLGSVMMKTMLPEDTYVAKAYVVDMPDSVREEMRELRVDWQQADREQLTEIRQEIQEKQVDGLVVFPADFDTVVENYQVSSGESAPNVEIYYNSAEPESAHFYNEVSEVLEQYETSLANKLDINAGDSVYYDCATSKDTTGQMFSMMMPLLLMMFLYSGCMSVAPESIAGEKERGTIATLLVTPMKRSSLALGKVFSRSPIGNKAHHVENRNSHKYNKTILLKNHRQRHSNTAKYGITQFFRSSVEKCHPDSHYSKCIPDMVSIYIIDQKSIGQIR